MTFKREVLLQRDVLNSIISYCQMRHPDQGLLILRGKSKTGNITVDGLAIPPFDSTGGMLAGLPHSFLPLDMSYVGTVRSVPTDYVEPAASELSDFFGLIFLTVREPYDDDCVSAWDRAGNRVSLSIVQDPDKAL